MNDNFLAGSHRLKTNLNLYKARGQATYSVKRQIIAIILQIKKNGLKNSNYIELQRLFRNLTKSHNIGLSPIEGHHVISVNPTHGIYKNSIDPYIDCEILSSCIADAIFETMKCILEKVYSFRIKNQKYKWEIFYQNHKIGDIFYDSKYGRPMNRLRALMTRKMIVICWRHQFLVTEAQIHFGPKTQRNKLLNEVLPVLLKKQKDFEMILATKPYDLFRSLIN